MRKPLYIEMEIKFKKDVVEHEEDERKKILKDIREQKKPM